MADISKIEEFWDDNPIDVSAEVNFIYIISYTSKKNQVKHRQ